MKPLYTFGVDGVFFSRNGTKAYQRGERPACLIQKDDFKNWEKTIAHHIERDLPNGNVRRTLVMFYRKKAQ